MPKKPTTTAGTRSLIRPLESLHLLVLSGLAVAQPIYDLLARHSGFFVVRRSEPVDVMILAISLSIVLPGLLAGGIAVLHRVHRMAGVVCHRLALSLLTAILALQAMKRLDILPGWSAVGAALAVGVTGAVLYHRAATARLFLSFLVPAIALFPVLFLIHPSVSKIVWPRHVEAHGEAEVASEAPIFLIVFDALPLTSLLDEAGAVDSDRFPSFASLAATATWHRNATTVSPDTIRAVPAILTGNYPNPELLPSYFDHPRNLFTLLGHNYRLELFEHTTDLCPPEICARDVPPLAHRLRDLAADLRVVSLHVLLPPELTTSLPQISQAWGDFAIGDTKPGKRNRSQKFRLFLDSIDPEAPRTLYFLHSLYPHAPYQYLPSGKRYTRNSKSIDPQLLQGGQWTLDEWPVSQSYRRHLLQVGLTDTLLGLLLDRLRETGLFDRSLIVVTADHGASFRPGDYKRRLSEANFPDIMPIPLFVKRPGQTTGAIDDRNVELIDVLPTIADTLGIALSWPTDGVSATEPVRPERPTKICVDSARTEFPVAAFGAKTDTVQRQTRAFGNGDFASLLRAGPHSQLVGRALADLHVIAKGSRLGSKDLSARIANPALLQQVDLGSDFLPILVEGFVETAEGLLEPLHLAVGINDTIGAVTRTHAEPMGPGLYAFSALLPEEALRAGSNDVEILIIEETPDGLRLVRTDAGKKALFGGVRLGVATVRGVGEEGFHAAETIGDSTAIRWTDGHARLRVPVDPETPPGKLRVDLALTGKRGNRLKISINHHRLFEGALPDGVWSRTFDLHDIAWDGPATLELESDSFVPAKVSGSPDARALGVAVAGIWLD